MNIPSPIMRTDIRRFPAWFDARKFRRELGGCLLGVAGLYCLFLLIWAAR